MIAQGGNEFHLLLDASAKDLLSLSDERVADAVVRMREEKISWRAGYDGVYGVPQFEKTMHVQEKLL